MKYPEDFEDKIICGDSLKVMPYISDNSIDLVVTSPPYNFGIDYGVYKDNLSWKEYYKWCEKWIREIYRILKLDGKFCLNHYLSCGTSTERTAPLMILNDSAIDIGFKHHGLAIWEDRSISTLTAWGSWMSASSPYINCPIEGILVLYKEFWKKQNIGESTIEKDFFIEACSGVWNIGTARGRLTPSPFPIKLPMLCIELLTYKNDIVLDPFIGQGTTAMACKESGRKYIGIELNPKYCEIARKKVGSVSGLLF